MAALEQGQAERARTLLDDALRSDPTDDEALLALVGLLRDQDQDASAAELLVAHLEHARDVHPLLVELGDVRLALGDPRGAAEALGLALRLQPAHAESLFLLGNAFLDVGAHAEAARTYERSLASNPFEAEAWFNLGCARLDAGDQAGAAEAWGTYLTCAPDAPDRAEVEERLRGLGK